MPIDPISSSQAVSAATAVPAPNEQVLGARQLVTAVNALNRSELYGQDRQLQFSRDPDTHTVVIKVVNPDTGEVLDQIPPEQVLQAMENLQQMGGGKKASK